MNSKHTDSTLRLLSANGSLSGAEIATALKISQPTVSRAIQASKEILRIGQSRSVRYALPKPQRDGNSSWSLYRVSENGDAERVGILHSLHQEEFLLEPELLENQYRYLLNGDQHHCLFSGLPWFLDDMRPQGYLGRLLAQTRGPELGIGPNPERWNSEEALFAILAFGMDTTGHFVLGGDAIDEVLQGKERLAFIDDLDRPEQYDLIARHISEESEAPNSSAGGEQPKFATCVRREDGEYRRVIVKFSGSKRTDAGRRWADLLKAEALASNILTKFGLPASTCSIVETDDRVYLEAERFDRAGRYGRIGAVTLRTIVAGTGGALELGWTQTARNLVRDGWLTQVDADRIAQMEWFGHLIGNNDMHHGNVSVYLTPSLPLRLCPTYDMLPMGYAPSRGGDLPTKPLEPRLPRPEDRVHWRPAAEAALQFWIEMEDTIEFLSDLRATVKSNIAALSAAISRA